MRRLCPLAILATILFTGPQASEARAAAVTGPPAPSFSLRDLDGKTFRLSDFKGKPVVLDFWATWCTPCRASMPYLSQLQDRYRERGLVVLGLALDDENPQQLKRYAEGLRIRFRLGMADDRVLNLYGPIRSIPTTIFINRRGEVVRRVVGYVDGDIMETYAEELFRP